MKGMGGGERGVERGVKGDNRGGGAHQPTMRCPGDSTATTMRSMPLVSITIQRNCFTPEASPPLARCASKAPLHASI